MNVIKLNIKYEHSDCDIDPDVDEAIESSLKELGYEKWSSGFDLVDNYRELCFKKKDKQ